MNFSIIFPPETILSQQGLQFKSQTPSLFFKKQMQLHYYLSDQAQCLQVSISSADIVINTLLNENIRLKGPV